MSCVMTSGLGCLQFLHTHLLLFLAVCACCTRVSSFSLCLACCIMCGASCTLLLSIHCWKRPEGHQASDASWRPHLVVHDLCDAERVACWRCATSVKSTVLLTHGQCPVPTDIALQPLVLQQHTPDVPAADLWRSDARPPAHRALRRRTAQHVGAAAMARPTRCNTSIVIGGEHHTARCRPSAMDASDVARPTTSIWYVTACCQSLSSDRCVNMNSRAQRPRAWQTFHI